MLTELAGVLGGTLVSVYIIFNLFRSKRTAEELKTERVVIIGASSGIGRSIALVYAKRGAKLILIARREELLSSVTQECINLSSQTNPSIHMFTGDITDESSIRNMLKDSLNVFGAIDTVVVCAGVITTLNFEDLLKCDESVVEKNGQSHSSIVIRRIFDTNSVGPILCAKYFVRELVKTRGRLVIVSSLAGVLGAPTRALYSASKFALTGFFNSLRIEMSNSLSITLAMPASVATDLRSSAIDVIRKTSHINNSSSGNTPAILKGISPEICAAKIVQAADERAREVYVPGWYTILVGFGGFFPGFVDNLAKWKYNNISKN